MMNRSRDPIAQFKRQSVAERSMEGQSCECGESRPLALVFGSSPTICLNCLRVKHGKSMFDYHHPAGRANNPLTVPIPANDHAAVLTEAQYDWPKNTWENPEASPLLAGAGSIRGYFETVEYMGDGLLVRQVELFEVLDEFLKQKLGPKWWIGAPLERFAPKRQT
jgi:hypothetical protein